jgi:hypothetical protein
LHEVPNRYLVPAPLLQLKRKTFTWMQASPSALHNPCQCCTSFFIPHSSFLASVSPPLSLVSRSLLSLPSSLAMTTSAPTPGPVTSGFRVSLRNHSVPRINACDFYALMAFEKQHAALFQRASAPRQGSEAMSGVAVQINAFNEVFNHSQYGDKLRALIDSAKRFDREYEPIVPPTTTGPRSDCAAPAPAPAAVGPVCIRCALPALPRCYSDEGRREVAISGLCEPCFDRITC